MNTRSGSKKASTGNSRPRNASNAGTSAAADATSSANANASPNAQGSTANAAGQTNAPNDVPRTPNTSTGGGVGMNSPATPPPMPQVPMTVHNLPILTFHEKNEKLFMDDKHIDALHPQHVPLTSADVENLHTQLRQFASTWPQVRITFQQYFSPRAQANVEDYILIKRIKVEQGDIWKSEWPELIRVLRQMFPESVVSKKDFISKSKIALTEYMINDIDTVSYVPS